MALLQAILVTLATSAISPEPYKNMSIGIEITLPSEAKVVATSNEPPSCMIQGGIGESSWHMKIDRVLDTEQQSAQKLAQLAYERQKTTDNTKILDERSITIGNVKSWWLRSSLHIEDAQNTTLCWLIVPMHGNQALIASILMTHEAWQLSGSALLSSLQSIKLLDPATVLIERMSGLDSSASLLLDLSKESLTPSIGISSWRQIQQFRKGQVRPDDIGYAHITSRIGTLSEIGTSNSVNDEKGLLVEVRSRIVPDQETKIVTDTIGVYWMSFDGKEEMWSSTTTRWKGKIRTVQKETGIRHRPSLGEPIPTLIILRQDLTSNRQHAPVKAKVTAPWLPKTLTWVIGPWLSNTHSTHLSWRTLNDYVDPPAETMRSDEIKATTIGFSVTTRMGDSDALVVTEYDHDGKLLRRTLGEGVVIFGVTEKTLQSIWEPKELW